MTILGMTVLEFLATVGITLTITAGILSIMYLGHNRT